MRRERLLAGRLLVRKRHLLGDVLKVEVQMLRREVLEMLKMLGMQRAHEVRLRMLRMLRMLGMLRLCRRMLLRMVLGQRRRVVWVVCLRPLARHSVIVVVAGPVIVLVDGIRRGRSSTSSSTHGRGPASVKQQGLAAFD